MEAGDQARCGRCVRTSLGGMIQGAGCRVQGEGCRVQRAGCRVQGAGCRVHGSGCRVQGAGCRERGAAPEGTVDLSASVGERGERGAGASGNPPLGPKLTRILGDCTDWDSTRQMVNISATA